MKTLLVLVALCLGCGRSGNRLSDTAAAVISADRLAVVAGSARAAGAPVAMNAMKETFAQPAAAPALSTSLSNSGDDRADAPLESNVDARKLIRNANMRIRVDSVAQALARIDSAATAYAGVVAESHATRDPSGRGDGGVVVRVPASKFGALLADLRTIGKVQDEQMSTDDVSKQYTDLETRIAVKDETVARLRTLLGTRTGKLSDVVDLERELSRSITELEQLKGERRFLDQQVAMSTVTVTLVEPNVIVASGLSASASDALGHSLALLHASALTVMYTLTFLAPWLPVLIGAWWLFGKVRARRASVASV
jgi:hypothetical protein